MEKPSQEKIRSICTKATMAFWDVVANSLPEIKTGDVCVADAFKWQADTEAAVQKWIDTNWPN